MISFERFKILTLILHCCIAITACDVVQLDENNRPIIPMTAEESASLTNMTPSALANKFWGNILNEAKAKAVTVTPTTLNKDNTLFVRLTGLVNSVDLSTKNATMHMESNGIPLIIQIGPIIRGNAIRDAASFLNFDQFKNQVQFARLSKELNKKAMKHFIRPDDFWVGNQINVLAAVVIKNNAITEAIPLEINKR